MSVTEVILSSQGAKGTASGDSPANTTVAYTANYTVTCSSPSDAPSTVLLHFAQTAALPWMGRPFRFGNGFDFTTTCRSVDASYIDKSAGKFSVTCSFESLEGDDQQQQQQAQGKDVNGKVTSDPTQWHDEIEFSFTQQQVVAEKATFRQFLNGKGNPYFKPDQERAITNSAGVPFDPPLTKDVNIRVIRITKRSKKCQAIKHAKYISAVNSDSFTIDKPAYGFSYPVSPYNCKFKSYSTSFLIDNKIKYFRETIELHIHPDGWRRQVLDQGTHRGQNEGDKDNAGNTISASDIGTGWTPYTQIVDAQGVPVASPVALDGAGQPLAAGKPHVYLVYSVEKELPFAGIVW